MREVKDLRDLRALAARLQVRFGGDNERKELVLDAARTAHTRRDCSEVRGEFEQLRLVDPRCLSAASCTKCDWAQARVLGTLRGSHLVEVAEAFDAIEGPEASFADCEEALKRAYWVRGTCGSVARVDERVAALVRADPDGYQRFLAEAVALVLVPASEALEAVGTPSTQAALAAARAGVASALLADRRRWLVRMSKAETSRARSVVRMGVLTDSWPGVVLLSQAALVLSETDEVTRAKGEKRAERELVEVPADVPPGVVETTSVLLAENPGMTLAEAFEVASAL
jgi:hypothetical protein